jgi:hypothetical protein
MILSVNSTPSAGFYTFLIQASDQATQQQRYQVLTQAYQSVQPKGSGAWTVVAFNGENSDEVSETWTVDDPNALLTTANDVPSFP